MNAYGRNSRIYAFLRNPPKQLKPKMKRSDIMPEQNRLPDKAEAPNNAELTVKGIIEDVIPSASSTRTANR